MVSLKGKKLSYKTFFHFLLSEQCLCWFEQKWNLLYIVSVTLLNNYIAEIIDRYLYIMYLCLFLFISRAECSSIGGSKDGTCADGFGVCCIGNSCNYVDIG